MGINRENRFHSSDIQKFRVGDIVRIKNTNQEAAVIGSHRDLYGSNDIRKYSLKLEDGGTSSWHHEDELELIETLEPQGTM